MKVQLHCEYTDVAHAHDENEAQLFRKEIDGKEIELEFMPAIGENITLFTKRGWVEGTVSIRGAGHAFEGAHVKPEFSGKTWYGIWFGELTIMEHY